MADCYKCSAKGHTCPAQTEDPENGRPLCAFCADGELCPVAKRTANAPAAVPPARDVSDVVSDAVSALRNKGFTLTQARNAVGAAEDKVGIEDLGSLIRAALAEGRKAAPPAKAPTTKKEKSTVMSTKCAAPGCDKPATRPSGHCSTRCYQRDYYHKTHPGSKRVPNARIVDAFEFTPPRKSIATTAVKKSASVKKSAPVSANKSTSVQSAPKPNGDAAAVDVSITGSQLDAWFSQLPVPKKGNIFQQWLEEEYR